MSKSSMEEKLFYKLISDLNGRKGYRIDDSDKDVMDEWKQDWLKIINKATANLQRDNERLKEEFERDFKINPTLTQCQWAYNKQRKQINELETQLTQAENQIMVLLSSLEPMVKHIETVTMPENHPIKKEWLPKAKQALKGCE